MPLETTILELPMTGSLDQNTDPRVVAPGSFLTLSDVQVDKAGAWRKRYGFGFLGYPNDATASQNIRFEEPRFPIVGLVKYEQPYDVFAVGPSLFSTMIRDSDSDRAPLVASWSEDTEQWEAKDDVPPFTTAKQVEVRSSREVAAGACVVIGTTLWTAYKVADPTAPKVYLRGTDVRTGAVVQDDVYFFTLPNAQAAFALIEARGLVTAVYMHEPAA